MRIFQIFKSNTDTICLGSAFLIAGVLGLIVSLTVANRFGPKVYGEFNLLISLMFILSQLSGAGIHFSVMKITPQYIKSSKSLKASYLAAILNITIVSLLVAVLIFIGREYLLVFFKNSGSEVKITLLIPAIFFYSLNKLNFAFLNGESSFFKYSILFSLRFIFLILSLIIFIKIEINPSYLIIIYGISELLVFIVGIFFLRKYVNLTFNKRFYFFQKLTISHGIRSMWGAFFIDANTKVDLLVLGLYRPEARVGVYGLSSIFFEAFYQLIIVGRTMLNPQITDRYYSGKEFNSWLRTRIRKIYIIGTPILLLMIFLFPYIFKLFSLDSSYMESYKPLVILLLGLCLNMGFGMFLMVFNQIGKPNLQSFIYVLTFSFNILLNFLFIPKYGILGAATATAVSYGIQTFIIAFFLRKGQQKILRNDNS